MRDIIISAGRAKRVVDIPGLGSYDLVTGRSISSGQFGKSGWAYACMDRRGDAIGQLPWRITRNDDPIEGQDHPLYEMLARFGEGGPNTSFSYAMKATEIDMCMSGAAYWLKLPSGRLARLNPSTMKVKTSSTGIEAFIQTINNKETIFQPDELVYFREFHPTDDLGPGVSKMTVARRHIEIEDEASHYVKAFFENDALPGLLFHTEANPPQAELDKFMDWWRARFSGARKAHKVAAVGHGLEAQLLTSNLKEMALVEIRDQARHDICTIFEVPMILVGSMTEATYANAHEAQVWFVEGIILPRADYYADEINAQLVEAIDPSVRFEWAVDELPILQEDKDAKVARLMRLKDGGIISDDAVREELGYPATVAPAEERELPPQERTLRSWRRKAMKALKAGKSADVPFETEDVAAPLQAAIRARLVAAKTSAEVDQVFRE